MEYNKIIIILTVGLGLASLFGVLARRVRLPSILGYLIAGYFIGPHFPGFVANAETSRQLAEIGVILMLFGVGLHFKIADLIKVKKVAVPGAIIQMVIATVICTFFLYELGWDLLPGVIIGLAIAVASTVVLVRVLTDYNLLQTTQGHIAVGWLVIEDILTVVVLLLLPVIARLTTGDTTTSFYDIIIAVFWLLIKLAILAIFMFTWGHKIVSYILTSVARLRSHELLTLTVLGLIFVIAAGSAFAFGTSIALGAFIAGMIIGQTEVKHQASANALPLKDIFAVVFFLSVGMLFNPIAIGSNIPVFLIILAVILLIKPLTAFFIVWVMQYPIKTAITVAVALAQIGEFSFILTEEALRLHLLPQSSYDVLVACALISISLNPLLFAFGRWIESKRLEKLDGKKQKKPPAATHTAIVVGYGPIGQAVTMTFQRLGINPLVIEHNIDVVTNRDGQTDMIYGDASLPNLLDAAHIEQSKWLVITIPEFGATQEIIRSALHLNPKIKIFARVRFASDKPLIDETIETICCEDESAEAFIQTLLARANQL